jgi:hypothetical protein
MDDGGRSGRLAVISHGRADTGMPHLPPQDRGSMVVAPFVCFDGIDLPFHLWLGYTSGVNEVGAP